MKIDYQKYWWRLKIKLKPLLKNGKYPQGLCAVARCNNNSVIVDATGFFKVEVPLCEKHFEQSNPEITNEQWEKYLAKNINEAI